MFLVVVFVSGRLPCKFYGGYHGDVLVLFRAGYHEGMFGSNTREVLFLFSVSYSCSCSRQVKDDSFEKEL
jgi:hypothetical protein